MLVEMLKITNYNGLKNIGETFEVDESTAKRWIKKGIASAVETQQVINYEDDIIIDKYEGMKAKELYELCLSKNIEAEPKKNRDHYIKLLNDFESSLDESGASDNVPVTTDEGVFKVEEE